MTDSKEMPARELDRHHRRARKAPLEQWRELGDEHGIEDAIACYATLSLSNGAATHQLQRQKMAARKARLDAAGIPDASIAAWLHAHTIAFARHFSEMTSRSGL